MAIEEYVRGLRQPINLSIEGLWDLCSQKNSVLMSYFLEGFPDVSHDELIDLMKNPLILAGMIEMIPISTDTPKLPEEIQEKLDIGEISLASYVSAYTDKKAFGFGNQLIIGKRTKYTHLFQNDETLDYSTLSGEVSANMPISTMAICADDGSIYLRENGIKFISALAKAAVEQPGFEKYKDILPRFGLHAMDIVLNHESVEAELLKDDEFYSRPLLEREIEVERISWENLQTREVPKKAYEFFHKLRSQGSDDPQKNVSYLVLQNL